MNVLLLAVVVAVVSWTITHEELFRECRDHCSDKAKRHRHLFGRKFHYVFTCEYCFSHYVSAVAVLVFGVRLVEHDWRGAVVAIFVLVALANVLMTVYALLRQLLKFVGGLNR